MVISNRGGGPNHPQSLKSRGDSAAVFMERWRVQ